MAQCAENVSEFDGRQEQPVTLRRVLARLTCGKLLDGDRLATDAIEQRRHGHEDLASLFLLLVAADLKETYRRAVLRARGSAQFASRLKGGTYRITRLAPARLLLQSRPVRQCLVQPPPRHRTHSQLPERQIV